MKLRETRAPTEVSQFGCCVLSPCLAALTLTLLNLGEVLGKGAQRPGNKFGKQATIRAEKLNFRKVS